MSIFTDLLHGKITFGQAASEASAWASKLISGNPTASTLVSDTLSAVKQGASNMVALADTELAQHYAQIVGAVEAGADAALNGATGGKALPAVPLVNGTIEQIAAAGKAALDAWALQAKASLVPVTNVSDAGSGPAVPPIPAS